MNGLSSEAARVSSRLPATKTAVIRLPRANGRMATMMRSIRIRELGHREVSMFSCSTIRLVRAQPVASEIASSISGPQRTARASIRLLELSTSPFS